VAIAKHGCFLFKMGTITALSAQKKSSDRVNVYLDGEFAFGLAYSAAATLRVGQMLSPTEVAALQAQDTVEKAHASATRLLAHRPRSQAEIQRQLQTKGYNQTVIDQVIERLAAVNLINDEQFARYWIEQRETFRPRGHLALRQELQQKGIAREIIEAALAGVDETTAARQSAERKAQQLAGLPEMEFKKKLGQYLQRRGFPYESIRLVTDDLWTAVGLPMAANQQENE
jgi:regulatory protein